MKKKRFTFGTVCGIDCLRGDPQFTVQEYLTEKDVDPQQVELVTLCDSPSHCRVQALNCHPGRRRRRHADDWGLSGIRFIWSSRSCGKAKCCTCDFGCSTIEETPYAQACSSRPRAVLKGSTFCGAVCCPSWPFRSPLFTAADFPMVLPGLPTSIASSTATTLVPDTPRSGIACHDLTPGSLNSMRRRVQMRCTEWIKD